MKLTMQTKLLKYENGEQNDGKDFESQRKWLYLYPTRVLKRSDKEGVLIVLKVIKERNKKSEFQQEFTSQFYGKFYGTPNKFGCIGTPSHKINNKWIVFVRKIVIFYR